MKQRTIIAILCLLAAQGALAWNGRLHMDITRAAARSVPEEMDAWVDYGKVLARYSIFPDLWKGDDKGEGQHHYIDVERFSPLSATNLPATLAEVEALIGRRTTPDDGVAPWAIMEMQQRLTAAMATNDWVLAARLATTLAHYVEDIHQPLHTTENFDGASGAAAGVHLRWEDQMPDIFWRNSMLTPGAAEYLDNPLPAVLQWIADSHALFDPVLAADREAAKAGGGVESRLYFRLLWQKTQNIFTGQANAAATHLASLWYTAWVDAGRPAIPEPPAELPEGSVWALGRKKPVHSAAPFLGVLALVGLIVVLLSALRGRKSASQPKP